MDCRRKQESTVMEEVTENGVFGTECNGILALVSLQSAAGRWYRVPEYVISPFAVLSWRFSLHTCSHRLPLTRHQ